MGIRLARLAGFEPRVPQLTSYGPGIAGSSYMWPDVLFLVLVVGWAGGLESPGACTRWPPRLASRVLVSVANVRIVEPTVDRFVRIGLSVREDTVS